MGKKRYFGNFNFVRHDEEISDVIEQLVNY